MNTLTQKLLLFALLFGFSLPAQTTADFENINVPPAGFLNDAGVDGFFFSGNAALPNYYDTNFDYWEGWAISKVTDTITAGFTNQYSAIAGGGASATGTYAVGYAFDKISAFLQGAAKGGTVSGIYVTNNTYTYYSLKDGDGFSKKFGGETGNDPDYFKLTIRGYNNGQVQPDSIEFYLADYRFSDNSNDYIVNEWTYIDLKPLGNVEEMTFLLSSTDNGQFGMNTPAYFCVDQLLTDDNTTGVQQPGWAQEIKCSPNPAGDFTRLEWPGNDAVNAGIYDTQGRLLQTVTLQNGLNTIDLQGYSSGIYMVSVDNTWIRLVKM